MIKQVTEELQNHEVLSMQVQSEGKTSIQAAPQFIDVNSETA